jgi:hypothetical protein
MYVCIGMQKIKVEVGVYSIQNISNGTYCHWWILHEMNNNYGIGEQTNHCIMKISATYHLLRYLCLVSWSNNVDRITTDLHASLNTYAVTLDTTPPLHSCNVLSHWYPIDIQLISNWYRISNWYPIDIQVISNWYPTDIQLISSWYPTDIQLISNWYPTDIQLISNWYPIDIQLISNWYRIDIQVISIWYPRDIQLISNWYPIDIQLISNW